MARGTSAGRGSYGALGLAAKVVDVLTAVIADFLVGPFDALFTFEKRKTEIAVNYAIAAAVYVGVGRLIAGLLRRPTT